MDLNLDLLGHRLCKVEKPPGRRVPRSGRQPLPVRNFLFRGKRVETWEERGAGPQHPLSAPLGATAKSGVPAALSICRRVFRGAWVVPSDPGWALVGTRLDVRAGGLPVCPARTQMPLLILPCPRRGPGGERRRRLLPEDGRLGRREPHGLPRQPSRERARETCLGGRH